jgi:multicomponent Na+:H+ antiporter subunit A
MAAFRKTDASPVFVPVHALYKASLFLVVGYLDQRTGTRQVSRLAGLAKAAPFAFVAAALAALSMSGLPPLLGAIAKELVYEAKLGAPEAPVLLIVAGSAGNALVIGCAVLAGLVPFLKRGTPPALNPVPAVRLLRGEYCEFARDTHPNGGSLVSSVICINI